MHDSVGTPKDSVSHLPPGSPTSGFEYDCDNTRRSLSVYDAVAIVVGMVIGAGIFRLPSGVAQNVSNVWQFMGVWVVGGLVSIIGALCYAELASAYPDHGGDYRYLRQAFGSSISFLFAWARMTVIQTGSIAVQAFVIGDYAATAIGGNGYVSSVIAAAVVVLLTGANIVGVRTGKLAQNIFTVCEVGILLAIIGVGAYAASLGPAPAPAVPPSPGPGIGLAMVLVLYTYGGWNEAAYLSAEVRGDRRSILRVLLIGLGLVTVIYLLANLAFVAGLGLQGVASSNAVAADLLRRVFGDTGARIISVAIVIAALSTVNATIFTGARTNYALGRDFPIFSAMGQWQARSNTPANALIIQGVITLALIALGTFTRGGFQTMVDYCSPVFWLFFLLAGIAFFVLRVRDPHTPRPFRVPLYPLTPLIFVAVCIYMLQASLAYHRTGAFWGVGVLLAGVPFMLLAQRTRTQGTYPVDAASPSPD